MATRDSGALQFALALGLAKALPRTGWVRSGVRNVESVADHSFRMALLGFALLPRTGEPDRQRCISMALVHDLAESLVGDITPDSGIAKTKKHRQEAEAIGKLADMLTPLNPEAADELKELWHEYDQAETTAAKFVKDLDKVDMALQALEYETRDKGAGTLEEFFRSVHGKIKSEKASALFEKVLALRKAAQGDAQDSM